MAKKVISFETPFSELDPEIQSSLSKIQENIQKQRVFSKEIVQQSQINTEAVQKTYKRLRSQITDLAESLVEERDAVSEFVGLSSGQLDTSDEALRFVTKLTSSIPQSSQIFYLPSPYMWTMYRSFKTRLSDFQRKMKEIEQFLSSSSSNPEPIPPTKLLEQIKEHHKLFVTQWNKISEFAESVESEKKKFLALRAKHLNDGINPFVEAYTQRKKNDPLRAIAEGQSDEAFKNISGAQLMEYASQIGVTPQDLNLLGPASVSALPMTKEQQKAFLESLKNQQANGDSKSQIQSDSSWGKNSSSNNGWGSKSTSDSSSGWGNNSSKPDSSSGGWGNNSSKSDSSSGWGNDSKPADSSSNSTSSGGWSTDTKQNSSTSSSGWGDTNNNKSSASGWGDTNTNSSGSSTGGNWSSTNSSSQSNQSNSSSQSNQSNSSSGDWNNQSSSGSWG